MLGFLRKQRTVPVLLQRDMTECGTTCLAMILKYHGLYNLQPTLRRLGHVSAEGTDLFTLSELAETFGFTADGYELGYDQLRELPLPCIAHYEGNHFVVIESVGADHVGIVDPAYGRDRLARADFESRWNGIVLTLEPTPAVHDNPDVDDLIAAQRERQRTLRSRFYLALLRPFRAVLGEILLASFVLQLLALALPFFTQVILDKALVYQDRTLLYAILGGMVLVLLTQILLTYVRNLLLTQFKVRFELDFFSQFFRHLISLPQRYFDAYKREDFINRFQENLKVRNAFSPSILQAFIDLLFVVNALIIFFFYNLLLAVIAAAFIGFVVLVTIFFTPRLKRLENKIFAENLKTMGSFLDTLLGIQTVKLLGLERLKLQEWKNRYKRALNKVLETEQTHIGLQSLLKSAFFLSQVGIYWIGAYLTFTGAMTIGQYVAFIAIFTLAMTALDNVSGLWFLVTELAITYERLNDVFMEEPETADLLEQHTQVPPGPLVLTNLHFAYPQAPDRPILQGIDLTIEPGERVALIGRNGSGKTTLAKLLAGLYHDYDGTITLGGVELRRLHPRALRRTVAMVPQQVHLFDGTFKDNIRYGNPEASMDDIVRAAELAGLHEDVQQLYLGYNTMIGESGSALSGGQRLKIAFARLFLADPDVIILDEASSALDPEAERLVMRNVETHFAGKTILSIAHRLRTVRDADRILVMDRGRIVEDGRHEDLLQREGLYYSLMQTYLNF